MSNHQEYHYQIGITSIRILDSNETELGRLDIPRKEYPVRTKDGEMIGIVPAMQLAVPLLLNHYRRNGSR